MLELIKRSNRRKKVTAKDIQENITRIKENTEWVNSEINKTIKQMSEVDRDTNEGLMKYNRLKVHLAELQQTYDTLQNQWKAQLDVLKKYKDSKFYIPPKDLLTIASVGGLAFFGISLDHENPKAMKLAQFVMKLFPVKF